MLKSVSYEKLASLLYNRCYWFLSAARDRAFAAGHERVGLIVDFANPRAEALYNSLGFERVNAMKFLGHDMWHMQAKKPKVG